MSFFTHKRIVQVLLIISLTLSLVAEPVVVHGEVILEAVLEILIPPLLIVDAVSCSLNGFWGCDSSGGGTTQTVAATACTTSANICGMTNSGDKLNDGSCSVSAPLDSACPACTSPANACGMTDNGYIVNGACNAAAPSNSLCPPPAITPTTTTNPGSFYPNPNIVPNNGSSVLNWNVPNATSCTVTGNGLNVTSAAVGTTVTGNVSTGTLTQTTQFTLSCEDGPGGPTASAHTTVIVNVNFQEF